MNFLESLSVGTLFQNIAFYSFLFLLLSLNVDVLKLTRKFKGVRS